jgi:hypothetical protein
MHPEPELGLHQHIFDESSLYVASTIKVAAAPALILKNKM